MVAPNELPADTAEPLAAPMHRTGNGGRFWGLALVLVVAFGYLTPDRRAAIGRFMEQLTDIVRDFRGYNPEF